MKTLHPYYRLSTSLAVAVSLAACSDETTAPSPIGGADTRVAITAFEGSRPVLLTGNIDGTNRTRIRFTNVTDSIPNNFSGLVVSDEKLLALGSPAISPNGANVAVVATLAYDQSEIVVMKLNGPGGKVASINTQIIASNPEWSPDGTKLAYTMSTKPGFSGIDLFVTDLATNVVTRLTTDQRLDQAAIRWSFDGKSIYYTRRGVGPATIPDLRVNELVRIEVASKAEQVVATGITGQVVSISSGATKLLLTRDVATTGGTPTRALIEATLSGGERVLVESDAAWARYLHGDEKAVVITATATGGDVTRDYSVMSLGSKSKTRIVNVSGEANVDAYLVPLPD